MLYTSSGYVGEAFADDFRLRHWCGSEPAAFVDQEELSVEMSAIFAEYRDGSVLLEWRTYAELDNAGFNVYRGSSADRPETMLNRELIPARGDDLHGAVYRFEDRDVEGGVTYHYWLEDVDLRGVGVLHGPCAVTTGSSPDGRDDGAPAGFALSQNYPNPFNPMTGIRYTLATNCHVSLEIYDVRGRLISTIVDGRQEAGQKTVYWDGTDRLGLRAAAGIYFYTLRTRSFSDTKKMILLR
jgi:hypothetical protein